MYRKGGALTGGSVEGAYRDLGVKLSRGLQKLIAEHVDCRKKAGELGKDSRKRGELNLSGKDRHRNRKEWRRKKWGSSRSGPISERWSILIDRGVTGLASRGKDMEKKGRGGARKRSKSVVSARGEFERQKTIAIAQAVTRERKGRQAKADSG